MKCILSSLFVLLLVQPASAQRKYNRVAGSPGQIITVRVEGGTFDLGSDTGAIDRRPEHTVRLSDFSIGAYEVTQAQWKAIMHNNPSTYECDECPVTNVSWDDVQKYITALNAKTGKRYRLPTEAEWEYAARGGNKEDLVKPEKWNPGGVNRFLTSEEVERRPEKLRAGKKYAGKHGVQPVAWYQGNSKDHIHPVGTKQSNELGLYDMSGNAEEWCADWYAKNYGSKDSVTNPTGPASGRAHVVRGGSWNSSAAEVTVTYRSGYMPDTKAYTLGFRLVEDK